MGKVHEYKCQYTGDVLGMGITPEEARLNALQNSCTVSICAPGVRYDFLVSKEVRDIPAIINVVDFDDESSALMTDQNAECMVVDMTHDTNMDPDMFATRLAANIEIVLSFLCGRSSLEWLDYVPDDFDTAKTDPDRVPVGDVDAVAAELAKSSDVTVEPVEPDDE